VERFDGIINEGVSANGTLDGGVDSIDSKQIETPQDIFSDELSSDTDGLIEKNNPSSIEESAIDIPETDERSWLDKTSDFFINSPFSEFVDNNISTPIIEGARTFRDTFGDSIDRIDEAYGTNLGRISTLVDIHDIAQDRILDPSLQEKFDKLFKIER
jgi:hypothetical protein